jgi:hypothetical protein
MRWNHEILKHKGEHKKSDSQDPAGDANPSTGVSRDCLVSETTSLFHSLLFSFSRGARMVAEQLDLSRQHVRVQPILAVWVLFV